jgi:thiol:disulfide interchange protein DsbD
MLMVRKIATIVLFLLVPILASAQIIDPVTWSFGYESKGDNQYEIILKVSIEEGSHIYGMEVPEGGPIATEIRFTEDKRLSFVDKIVSNIPPNEKYDEAFGMDIETFEGKVEFRQLVKSTTSDFTLYGYVEYMSCNNISCSPPKEVEFNISVGGGDPDDTAVIDGDLPATPKKGLLGFFIASFLLGLVGVLTPCVYPMIPLTVAFFARSGEEKKKGILNALIFGISIVIIYSSPGIIISLTGAGAGFANALSTHWIPNMLFFLLFVVFAVSFLGAFEITLPSKWSNATDSKVDKGGIIGSFFMALTTVIVSFSCTGPIVGGLLVEAVRGDVIRPTVGMFAFGLAFSVPFTLFALSPKLLGSLPKSGYWLKTIKTVLGFLMLAFSMKFLMIIDSVYSLGILTRKLYLAIWIVLFLILGFYLLNSYLQTVRTGKKKGIGVFIMALASAGIAIYLAMGFFGSSLKAVSALLPAEKIDKNSQDQSAGNGILSFENSINGFNAPKYSDLFSLPYGLTGFFDLDEGLAYAKKAGKPVLIDFKGHACANCKRMEAKVWSDPEVIKRLKENFVLIALYVDDRTQLPESEWRISSIDGKVKKTIGKINEDIEISRYNTNALPYYVIADYSGNPLNTPSFTNLDIESYISWLDEGISNFK